MPGLSNIFGSDNDSSQNSNDGAINTGSVADVGSVLGLDATNSNSQSSTDEDGNTQQSASDQTLGVDTSTDGLLGNVTDAFGSSDSATSDQ